MKTIILVLACLLVSPIVLAERPIAPALEWWIRSQGKFTGAEVCTKENYLTSWNVPGVPKPDAAGMKSILNQYDAYLAQEAIDKADRSIALKTKLKINDSDIAVLKELLK